MNFDEYAKAVAEAEKFPLGSVVVVVLVVTVCVAVLMILSWFLFRTKLPRLDNVRRSGGSDNREP